MHTVYKDFSLPAISAAWLNDVDTAAYYKLSISPQDFMTEAQKANVAANLGTLDVTAAFQSALNTGRPMWIPEGTYLCTSTLQYVGTVWIKGTTESIILRDGDFIHVVNGTNSLVDGFTINNIITPTVIFRDPTNWYAPMTLVQSNADGGYMPTVNDSDVYPSMTTAQKNEVVGGRVFFEGNASGITISNMRGRFMTLAIFDAQYSSIVDNIFKSSRDLGGAVFWNINGQIGRGNTISRNVIKDTSNSHVVFARNVDGFCSENKGFMTGESGIKFFQDTVAGVEASCFRMSCLNNSMLYGFYDAFDLSSSYGRPVGTTTDTRHNIQGNDGFGFRQYGLFKRDGGFDLISNNKSRQCGAGAFSINAPGSFVHNNYGANCVDSSHIGNNAFEIGGDGYNVADNSMVNSQTNATYSIYAPGNNVIKDNYTDGLFFLGNAGSISAIANGNQGSNFATRDQHTWPMDLRQNNTISPALGLYTEDNTLSSVQIKFQPRRQLLSNPSGSITSTIVTATPGAEAGRTAISSVMGGVETRAITALEGHASGKPMVALAMPPAAALPNPTTDLQNNECSFGFNESNGHFFIYVKTTTGAVGKLDLGAATSYP